MDEEERNRLEKLVQADNQRIRILRIGVFLLLGLSAALTSWYIYRFKRDTEEEALHDTFFNVAEKLVSGLISDLSLKV